MKILYIVIFTLLITTSTFTKAGNIILCKQIEKGEPINISNVWNKTDKGKICIFYEHDKTYSENTSYSLRISKKNNIGYFIRVSSKDFPVQKGKQTSVIYNDILDIGSYIFTIIDDKGFILGETNCTIQ